MKLLLQLVLSAMLVVSAAAKRMAPDEVPPVVAGKVTISVPHFTQINGVAVRGGVLEARDTETKKLVWSVQVYATQQDPALEGDVQDVFIKTLSYDATHGLVIVSDEAQRVFVVDLKTQQVTPILRDGKGGQKP